MSELKVYTADEVAELLTITKRTVYNYIKSGRLPATKMGKYWRVTEDDLRRMLGASPEEK